MFVFDVFAEGEGFVGGRFCSWYLVMDDGEGGEVV